MLSFLYGPILTSIHDSWKNHNFDYADLYVGKVISLIFNILSKLVITFLPRSRGLLISWLQSPSAVILEPPKTKSLTVSIVHHLFAMKWWDQMQWSSFFECGVLSQLFHSPLFTFIQKLFSSSSLSAIRVVSSAYLRLLTFLLEILIRACASSSPGFLLMYSAYKLNKQGHNNSLDTLLSLFGNSLLFHVQF